jgi:hypothetical protein
MADPFKQAVSLLKDASQAERAGGADTESRCREAIRLYTAAMELLTEALASGDYTPKITGVIERKVGEVEARIALLRGKGGAAARAPGETSAALRGSGRADGDPFKASVAVLHSAVEADAQFKAGDASLGATALEMYAEGLRLLDTALESGSYNAQVLDLLRQKSTEVRGRVEVLGPLAAEAAAAAALDEGVPPSGAAAASEPEPIVADPNVATIERLEDEARQMKAALQAAEERERSALEAALAHAADITAKQRAFDEAMAAKQAEHEQELLAERARSAKEQLEQLAAADAAKAEMQGTIDALQRQAAEQLEQLAAADTAKAEMQGTIDALQRQASEQESAALVNSRSELERAKAALEEAEAALNERVLVATAQKMRMRSVTKGMNAWRAATVRKLGMCNRMTKAILRLQRMAIHSAFSKWGSFAATMRRRRAAAARVVARCTRRRAFAAFSTWTVHVLKLRRRRGLGLLVTQRLQHRRAVLAFDAWAGVVSHGVAERQHAEELAMFRGDLEHSVATMDKRIIASVAQKLKMRAVTRSINMWRSFALRRITTRHKLHKVVRRIQKLSLSRAMLSWQSVAERAVHVRRIAMKAMARVKQVVVANSFDAMVAHARKMVRVRAMMLRWRLRRVMVAFSEWADLTADEVAERRRSEELAKLQDAMQRANTELQQSADQAQQLQATAAQDASESMAQRVQDLERLVSALRDEAVAALPGRLEANLAAAKLRTDAEEQRMRAEKRNARIAELKRLELTLSQRIEQRHASDLTAAAASAKAPIVVGGAFQEIHEEGSLPALRSERDAVVKELAALEEEAEEEEASQTVTSSSSSGSGAAGLTSPRLQAELFSGAGTSAGVEESGGGGGDIVKVELGAEDSGSLGIEFRHISIASFDPDGLGQHRAAAGLEAGMILRTINDVPAERLPYSA